MAAEELYISVDVEASGPIPGRYSLLSLGAVVVEDPRRHFYVELKPISPDFDPSAIAMSGLSLERLRLSGSDPIDAMNSFAGWVEAEAQQRTPVFVGFNAAFDWSFVNWYFHTYVGHNPFGFAPLDIKSLYMGAFGGAWADTRSSRLQLPLKPQPATHNALDDATWQAEVFQQIMKRSPRSS